MYGYEITQYIYLVPSKVSGIHWGFWNVSPMDNGGLLYAAEVIHRMTTAERMEE